MEHIPVFKPSLGSEELAAVKETFDLGWVGLGPKTAEFEKQFAAYVGAKHAIALNSATAALHLSLQLAEVTGKEVITTSMTFVSTNHAILYNGGIPVFVDIEADTLNIDTAKIESAITSKTRAIVCVHYGGHACNLDAIHVLAKKHNLIVIEDAAHADGSDYRGKKIGSLSDLTCFSFHAVKNLTTGEGGMITTNNDDWAEHLKKLRWLGISKSTFDRSIVGEKYDWYYDVEEVGWKCHMSDINAAIGIVQLRKLDDMNNRRRNVRDRYNLELKEISWIELPVEKEYTRSASHNYVIKVDNEASRNGLIAHLRAQNIATGVHYIPNHLYEIYAPYRRSLPITEEVWRRIITLPLYPDMTDEEFVRVVEAIKNFKP